MRGILLFWFAYNFFLSNLWDTWTCKVLSFNMKMAIPVKTILVLPCHILRKYQLLFDICLYWLFCVSKIGKNRISCPAIFLREVVQLNWNVSCSSATFDFFRVSLSILPCLFSVFLSVYIEETRFAKYRLMIMCKLSPLWTKTALEWSFPRPCWSVKVKPIRLFALFYTRRWEYDQRLHFWDQSKQQRSEPTPKIVTWQAEHKTGRELLNIKFILHGPYF